MLSQDWKRGPAQHVHRQPGPRLRLDAGRERADLHEARDHGPYGSPRQILEEKENQEIGTNFLAKAQVFFSVGIPFLIACTTEAVASCSKLNERMSQEPSAEPRVHDVLQVESLYFLFEGQNVFGHAVLDDFRFEP